jgi:ribonuclease HII
MRRLRQLNADTRSGARAILAAVVRRRFDNWSEGQRLRKLLRYEGALWAARRAACSWRG